MTTYHYQGHGYDHSLQALELYSRGQLLDMFYQMLRIRRVEESIESRYHEDEMKTPIHLVIGQEASAVGICSSLTNNDLVYCSHRTHGVYLAKGGDLNAMLSEFYCRANGCVGSKGGSMHLLDKKAGMAGASAIVAGVVPIATGAAFTAYFREESWVSTVFFGDAATEEGAMWESLNFAALKRLPVIYICENNYYSVCTPLASRQPAVDIYRKAESFGLNSMVVDGTNVLAVREAMTEATSLARRGKGPSFIETRAYRWRGHGGAGDDSASGYRDPEEVALWQQHCPIESFAQFLTQNSVLDPSRRQAMETRIGEEINAAFDFAIASEVPTEKDLYRYVYSE